ncbi:unnamed protein product [Arabis nemorensis]|uniref:Replication factor-A protein 1 N-terminal domain-containing protein n=1 Tax=Arabis nemorensis TaxID=586526 RepID=A0A565BVU7_9BRAS|nr:unnamed protein product [Arabis nemorensis]
MEINLTSGVIKKIIDGEVEGEADMIPVMQVTEMRLVKAESQGTTTERFRVILSDGIYLHQGMLRSDLNKAEVCLEEKDMEDGLFKVPNLEEVTGILIPHTPEKLKELIRFSFVKPIKGVPSFFPLGFYRCEFVLFV